MIRRWNHFWFAPTSAKPLGAIRILFGLIVLLHLAILVPDLETWFTDSGRLRGNEAKDLAGAVWSARFNVPMRWSPLQSYRSIGMVRAVFASTAIVAALFTLGWRTRIMGILLYAGLLTIHHANILTTSGADVLLSITSFYLMLSPCGAAYSLDSRRQAKAYGGSFSALVAPWSQRLIAIQITVIYFMTAFLKSQGKSWADGSALYYVLSNAEVVRFSLGLTKSPALLNALTFGTVIAEFSLAFLLWVRAARPLMIAVGIMLHVGIMLTISIPIFGELMMMSYIAYLTPVEWNAVATALSPSRLWKRSSSPAIPGRVDPGHSAEPSIPHHVSTNSQIPANPVTKKKRASV